MTPARAAAKTPPQSDPDEIQEVEDDAILNLEQYANPERPTVMFRTEAERDEGKEPTAYEVRIPEDMGVVEEQQYRSEVSEYTELMRGRNLNSKQRDTLKKRLDFLFDRALIASAAIKAEFNDRQKQAVITLFTTALFTADAAAVERALPMISPEMMARVLSTTES